MPRHARASQTHEACAAAHSWNSRRRNASSVRLANICLSHGHGKWQPLPRDQEATEPYLLDPRLQLVLKREPRHWWGICDVDLIRNATNGDISERPPRPAVLHEWEPDGEGCASLRKERAALPTLGALACSFCKRHAGENILFVGDSVQGELFLAFASVLGIMSPPRVDAGNSECRRVAPRGSGSAELDVSIDTCAEATRAVTVRFIRNELLLLDGELNARRRHPDRRLGAPALMLCEWRSAAQWADRLVLNRGYHSLSDPNEMSELGELNATMAELSALASTSSERAWSSRVVYRGTHASFRACHSRPDPEVQSWDDVAALMRSRSNAQYNWRRIEQRASQTRAMLEHLGVPYMDTYVASALRPGGRMPNSCNHFCLPGPIDDWVRLLIARWT